jgi:hypothetical protein
VSTEFPLSEVLVTQNLEPGWERYMTDDLFLGKRNADQIVAEFIEQRKGIERSRLPARMKYNFAVNLE